MKDKTDFRMGDHSWEYVAVCQDKKCGKCWRCKARNSDKIIIELTNEMDSIEAINKNLMQEIERYRRGQCARRYNVVKNTKDVQ